MNRATYNKVRPGARVVSRVELGNGLGRIAANTVFVVKGKRSGFDLLQETRCPHCGVQFSIHHVQPNDVELLGEPDPRDLTGTTRRAYRNPYDGTVAW